MKKLVLLIVVALPLIARSQTDSVILKAMTDELSRNMKELSYPGFEKPFFISYGIEDVRQYEIAATMGALLRSNESRSRAKNIRVLVGDYDFNDESLDNESFSAPEANEIQLPLDDDYYGIRRALWVTTDYVYKGAARQYKKNQETLAEKKKTIAGMPHRRFARSKVEHIFINHSGYAFDMTSMEKYLREISDIFSSYPAVEYSTAYLSFTQGYSYLVNSEGTRAKTPVGLATLQIFGQRKTKDGEPIFEQLTFQGFSPADFPSRESVTRAVQKLCDKLSAEPLKVFEDEYSGPILLAGHPVAEMFSRTLFSSRDALIAPDALPDDRGYRPEASAGIDSRIGKLVVSPSISVTARPSLKTFNGVSLVGSYEMDDEGIAAPKEVYLIEKGFLRELLNDRSLIKPHETANGHSGGPAVIDISLSTGHTMKQLKELLVAEAKKQGLEYALILSAGSDETSAGMTITRISVADGKEEPMRGAFLEQVELKELRDILGGMTAQKAYNLQSGGRQGASFIVPEGILLREAEVRKGDIRFFKEEQYVSSPFRKTE